MIFLPCDIRNTIQRMDYQNRHEHTEQSNILTTVFKPFKEHVAFLSFQLFPDAKVATMEFHLAVPGTAA